MIEAVFFDFDGVISDSLKEVYEIYKIIGKELNVEIPGNIRDFRSEFNIGYMHIYKKRNMTDNEIGKANKIFRREIERINPGLYPGIKNVISILADKYKLFLISANFTVALQNSIKYFNMENCFTEISGQDKGEKPVDKSEVFLYLIKKYQLNPNRIIAVGDRTNDFLDAGKAGIKNIIMANYGWGYDREIVKDALSVEKPEEIIGTIENLN